MFTLFFTIIFLAELIITGWLIWAILKLDSYVCALNEQILESHIPIKKTFLNLNLFINRILLSVTNIKLKLEEKKKNYLNTILKSILVTILFLTMDKKGKQILSTADTILSVIKLINKIIKRP